MGRQWGEHCAVRLNFIKRAGDKLIKSTQPMESNRQVETTAPHFLWRWETPTPHDTIKVAFTWRC